MVDTSDDARLAFLSSDDFKTVVKANQSSAKDKQQGQIAMAVGVTFIALGLVGGIIAFKMRSERLTQTPQDLWNTAADKIASDFRDINYILNPEMTIVKNSDNTVSEQTEQLKKAIKEYQKLIEEIYSSSTQTVNDNDQFKSNYASKSNNKAQMITSLEGEITRLTAALDSPARIAAPDSPARIKVLKLRQKILETTKKLATAKIENNVLNEMLYSDSASPEPLRWSFFNADEKAAIKKGANERFEQAAQESVEFLKAPTTYKGGQDFKTFKAKVLEIEANFTAMEKNFKPLEASKAYKALSEARKNFTKTNLLRLEQGLSTQSERQEFFDQFDAQFEKNDEKSHTIETAISEAAEAAKAKGGEAKAKGGEAKAAAEKAAIDDIREQIHDNHPEEGIPWGEMGTNLGGAAFMAAGVVTMIWGNKKRQQKAGLAANVTPPSRRAVQASNRYIEMVQNTWLSRLSH